MSSVMVKRFGRDGQKERAVISQINKLRFPWQLHINPSSPHHEQGFSQVEQGSSIPAQISNG